MSAFPIGNIAIIGSGPTGWLAAATLARVLARLVRRTASLKQDPTMRHLGRGDASVPEPAPTAAPAADSMK